MASCPSVDPDRWSDEFEALAARPDRRFPRIESRMRLRRFLRGMMSELQRINCRTLAEDMGEDRPGPMQHFLTKAVWDDDALRHDLRDYVTETLGQPDGVLTVTRSGNQPSGDSPSLPSCPTGQTYQHNDHLTYGHWVSYEVLPVSRT
ncbi:transposase [Parafrankia elaeagni]|uniref:transposase n=1 Tax=Parafrankia elaeagni TaxID=222534 RepID=UPI0003727D3F|nr:transposase [Parafrankia elaeagni]